MLGRAINRNGSDKRHTASAHLRTHPMDPQQDGAPAPGAPRQADTPPPYPEWGRWFTRQFEDRGMRNTTMVKRLDAVGANGRYTSSDITMWKSGRKRPSEAGAMYVAAAWSLPAHLVVREAGYSDFANFLQAHTPDVPPLPSIRAEGEPGPGEGDLERDLALVEELIALRIEKLRRTRDEPAGQRREDAS